MSMNFCFRRSFVLLVACLAVGLSLANARAQDNSASFVFGTIKTSKGEPAAEADVWLVGWDDDRFEGAPKILSKTVSGSDGAYAFELANGEALFRNPGQLTVWAASKSGELGWFNGLYQHKQKRLAIKLKPTTTFAGQLVDGNGKPIANAEVTPNRIYELPYNQSNRRIGKLSEEARERLVATTDADGKFEIDGISVGGSISCDIKTPGFDKLSVLWNVSNPVVAKLDSGPSLSGKIIFPATTNLPSNDEFKFGTLTFTSYTHYDSTGTITEDTAQSAYLVNPTYNAIIDRDGKFLIAGLAPGKYRVSAALSGDLPMLLPEQIELTVEPNVAINDFSIKANPAFKVSGRVVGSVDNKPVAGAEVKFLLVLGGNGLVPKKSAITDLEGNYFAFVKKAKYILSVSNTPDAYVPSADSYDSEFAKQRLPRLDVVKDTVWPDLKVDPAKDITIDVFDEYGNPAVGAVVNIVTFAGFPARRDYRTVHKTDANGKYVIRQVTSNDTLPIRVYTPNAISDPALVITPSEHEQPLRIDLSPDHGVRLRCKVVDRIGEPIAGAIVSIATAYPAATKWLDRRTSQFAGAGSGKTDANGNFVSGPVWSDLGYSLTAKADGYEKSETPRRSIEGDESVEFKPIVLAKTKVVSVSGVVVDSKNQPLEGVGIYAAGKTFALAKSLTNGNGEFHLDGLASDVRYVFADLKDYRLSGARVSGQPLEITLRGYSEPSKGIRPGRELDREDQLKTAAEIVNLAWSLPISNHNTSRMAMLEAMTKIDENQAMKMSVQSGGTFNSVIQIAKAKQLVDSDPDQAAQLLRTLNKRTAIFRTIAMAKRAAMSNSDSEKSSASKLLAFAHELVANDAYFSTRLAFIHTLLGEHEKAKELNAEVAKGLDIDAITEQQESTARLLAISLAPYDFEGAQKFASASGSVVSQTYALSDVALAILPTDQEKSLAEIEKLTGDSNAPNIRDRSRYRAAYALVESNPTLAIKLVYKCEESDNRAQALGRLAVEVAKTDQSQAWKMIDDALAIYRRDFISDSNSGRASTFVAAIAYQAHSIGYPDMESVVWHVRAACRANGEKGQGRLSATIGGARLLALIDKFAARELLSAIAVNADQIPRENYGVSLYDRWLQAWILVDFGRGASLVREELQEMKEAGVEDPLRYGHGDVFRILVANPEDRFKILLNESRLWRLEVDGTVR